MTQITITGCQPYDGTYEIDLTRELTTREWGWIKRLAGYLPLAVTDETFGDPEMVCVLAVIAMRRADRIEPAEVPKVYERLADAPFGSAITFDTTQDEQVGDAGPPPVSSSSSADTSGTASKNSSGSSAPPRRATGTGGSGSSASGPVTLVS